MTPAPGAPEFVIAYGVWLPSIGWLSHGKRVFMDPRREVAESAAALWGRGARVMACDESLVDLQDQLLEHQAEREQRRWWSWRMPIITRE